LLNRRGFARALDGHLARISRYGPAGSLVMVDLDNFKEYNDAVGHVAGDQFLVKVARVLASRLRESDVLARLGGDEFAVLLPCADQLAARRAARALLNVVRGVSIPHSVDGTNRVTASIGIASFEAGTKTAEEIMVNADVAMYEAKAQGRNRVVHYSGDLRES
jgi:diguanylate cyclase (GGDEF)-like protein